MRSYQCSDNDPKTYIEKLQAEMCQEQNVVHLHNFCLKIVNVIFSLCGVDSLFESFFSVWKILNPLPVFFNFY